MKDGFIWSSGADFTPQAVWSASEWLEAVSLAEVDEGAGGRQRPFGHGLAGRPREHAPRPAAGLPIPHETVTG